MEKTNNQIRDAVRNDYSKVVENYNKNFSGCCRSETATVCCGGSDAEEIEKNSFRSGYSPDELKIVPEGANLGLSCGNPQAIASIQPGEVILDLGSGAGFDVFLAANQTGRTGKVIGVDMTPQMIEKAKENAEKGEYRNVEFLLGEIEQIPVEAESIDVVISNCVVNLSPEKQKVFDEVYRILKKGGRVAISDIVTSAELPGHIRDDMRLYSECVSGASVVSELERLLKNSGFKDIRIEPLEKNKTFISEWKEDSELGDCVYSANITARKY